MKLIKILTSAIQIKSDNSDFANCHINDLIKISDGEVDLVTMISSLQCREEETPIEDDMALEMFDISQTKTIECAIIGSIVNGKFTSSIDRYPSTSVEAEMISSKEFSAMLQPDVSDCFKIGAYAGYDTPAYVNGNKFYQRHSCIVGNTGSGKSETVTKFVEETAKNPGANLIIFDIHGEYGGLSYVDNIKMGQVPFPVWMLGFSDMVQNLLKIKEETSTVVMSALRKCYKEHCPSGNEAKPARFSYDDILERMERLNSETILDGYFKNGAPKIKNGEYNGKLSSVINSMKAKRDDKRYSFLFEECYQGYLLEFLNRIMGAHKLVKNIDLSEVPHDIAIMIIGAITKLVYNVQITKKDATPITLVCDEAHVYIPADFQLSASQRRMVEIFENIAKEGRKFGTTLFVASQRPSELNKTIMAQCANYIVMKLNNENDKSMMKGVMAEGSSGIIETTTMFSSGDCLIIGDAVPIPLKIKVELAKERPQAKTIEFWDIWKKERATVDYSECLDEYLRN